MQRRRYERLDSSCRSRRRLRIAKIGKRKKKFWSFRLVPKLKLKWLDPKLLLAKLRDGYVNMMLNLADSSDVMGGGFGPCYVAGAANQFRKRNLKDHDAKILVGIYKSFMVDDQMGTLH
ncbi:hypothetical protein SUGI_0111280 [Cryptomeria japonica]|nr:hypothetical protein SUGI_0111280 [Cryptomeria japonica]